MCSLVKMQAAWVPPASVTTHKVEGYVFSPSLQYEVRDHSTCLVLNTHDDEVAFATGWGCSQEFERMMMETRKHLVSFFAWAMARYGVHLSYHPFKMNCLFYPDFLHGFLRLALIEARIKARRFAKIARNFGTYAKRYRAACMIVRAVEAAVLNPYTALGRARLLREFRELGALTI